MDRDYFCAIFLAKMFKHLNRKRANSFKKHNHTNNHCLLTLNNQVSQKYNILLKVIRIIRFLCLRLFSMKITANNQFHLPRKRLH